MPTLGVQESQLLANMAAAQAPEISTLNPLQVREMVANFVHLNHSRQAIFRQQDFSITGDHPSFQVRVYWPSEQSDLPALIYFHGGGYVFGTLDHVDELCKQISHLSQHIVISVDYPLAPEFQFPTQTDCGLASYQWAVQQAKDLGLNPNKIAMAGDSAGGNLAIVSALQVTQTQNLPAAVALILLYPAIHFNCESASYEQYAEGLNLTKNDMIWFRQHYLSDPEQKNHWKVDPTRSDQLQHLPRTLIITAEFDVLQAEGKAFYQQLQALQVPVEHRHYPNTLHGFAWFHDILDAGQEAIQQVSAFLSEATVAQ